MKLVTRHSSLVTAALAALFAANAAAAPFERELHGGAVTVTFEGDAEVLSLGADYTATLTAVAPAGYEVDLPAIDELRGRFQGFALAEGYAREPRTLPDGSVAYSTRWRLAADPSAERFRLAPFAFTARDASGAEIGSFATQPVLFPLASLPSADGSPEVPLKKFFTPPTPRAVLKWILRLLGAAVLVALVLFVADRLRRAARLRRMTPSERALAELAALLDRRLPQRGLFKDYYVELTHVVRRYIERAHAIRAPRLTTEEFLAAAKRHPHFTPESLQGLSDFLHSADMVKFAGAACTDEIAGSAAETARRYIERDGAQSRAETSAPAAAKGGAQ